MLFFFLDLLPILRLKTVISEADREFLFLRKQFSRNMKSNSVHGSLHTAAPSLDVGPKISWHNSLNVFVFGLWG